VDNSDKIKLRKSYRLSQRTVVLIEKLALEHDATETRVIEDAIREKAKREGIKEEG